MASTTSAPDAGSSSTPLVLSVAPSKKGRSPGKAHKSQKEAKARSYMSASIKTPYEKRREADLKKASIKGIEKDMKEEEEAARERKRNVIRDRRERAEEKKRMEEAAARMSAKKLQRLRKRQGRSKKING